MSILKDIASRLFAPARSVDRRWQVAANTRLLSSSKKDGTIAFFTDEDTACAFTSKMRGYSKKFEYYDIFAPDAIIHKVSGSIANPKKNKTLIAYTDGSFVHKGFNHIAGYGVFCRCDDLTAEYANTILDNAMTFGSMGGEFAGAVVAIKVAIVHGYEKVEIHHDFDGVATFSENSNATPKTSSKMYWLYEQYKAFLDCVSEKIEIKFVKVKAHALDVGNEHANFLASTHAKRHAMSIKNKKFSMDEIAAGVSSGARSEDNALDVPENDEYDRLRSAVPEDFVPVFRPKQESEIGQKRITDGTIKNLSRKLHVGEHVGCLEVEYQFVSSGLSEILSLTDEETLYVRYVLSGARGNHTISNKMQCPSEKVSYLRRCCCAKMGLRGDDIHDGSVLRKVMLHLYSENDKLDTVDEKRALALASSVLTPEQQKSEKQSRRKRRQQEKAEFLTSMGLVLPAKDASVDEKKAFNEKVQAIMGGR